MLQTPSHFQPQNLNLQAFVQHGQPLSACTPLQNLERLVLDLQDLKPKNAVDWQARGECRPSADGEQSLWLHLQAHTSVPLTCRRCLRGVDTLIEVDRWFRFVATEELAQAQDELSEEDVLVLESPFNLLTLLEDELLLELPVVPLHEECAAPYAQTSQEVPAEAEKPHPFAVLQQLKKK